MSLEVRPAQPGDAQMLGRMGAALAALHHKWDPQRFMLPPNVEEGYRRWLQRESSHKDAVVLVAELDGAVVGYAYGRLEGLDWNALLDAHGGFHDLWVEPSARKSGAGALLAKALVERLTELGAPRIVLMTATGNESAQKLFARLGFRNTLIEMTREAGGG